MVSLELLTSRRNCRVGNPTKFHLFADPMVNEALVFESQVSDLSFGGIKYNNVEVGAMG
jgi:hypothetical protein